MMQIRQACIDDLNLLSQLGKETYRAHFRHIWYRKEEMEEFLARDFSSASLSQSLVSPGTSWLLASIEGKHVGFAKINWNSPLPNATQTGAELQKIYFRADITGKKMGQQLFDHIVQLSTAKHQHQLWLEVLKLNQRALAFYLRQGLSIVDEDVFQTASQKVEMWIMAKPLG